MRKFINAARHIHEHYPLVKRRVKRWLVRSMLWDKTAYSWPKFEGV